MKIHNTRKQRAKELLTRMQLGPAFSDIGLEQFTPQIAALQYSRWVRAWVLPELQRLVPELKVPAIQSLASQQEPDPGAQGGQ